MTHDFIQAQTIQNMELMRGGQGEAHVRRREAMRKTAEDPVLRRAYMLRQAMIESLKEAEAIP
jgi:3-(3-hydroxy-phenyl)propionate hydroxylase